MNNYMICEIEDYHLFNSLHKKYFNIDLKYGWKSNNAKSYDFGHWNRMLLKENTYFPYDHSKMPMIDRHPEISSVWNIVKEHVPENRGIYRTYINAYTYGTDAYSHVDENNLSSSERAETAIIYLNNTWDHDWAGETVLYDKDFDIDKAVLPKPGRILIFDSSTLHSARPVTRMCPVLRSILAIKTFNTDYSSKEIEFLIDKTVNVNHSGKTFFEHLYNTSMQLRLMNQSKEVCAAGLYHSIYGTEYFQFESDISRETVRELIGDYAESLAYEFCTLKNRYFTLMTGSVPYSPEFTRDLLAIEYANLYDQNDGRHDSELSMISEKLNMT